MVFSHSSFKHSSVTQSSWKANQTDYLPLKLFLDILGLAEKELTFPMSAPIVLCLGSKEGVGNIPVFWVHPGSAGSASVLLSPAFCPPQEPGGGQGLGRGHNQDNRAKLTRRGFHTIWLQLRYKS